MKKIFKKITIALPVALILSLILAISASATTSVIWQELDDKTITDGTKEYTLFESPYAIREGSPVQFVYENGPYGDYVNIYSYEKYGDIAWTDYGYIFVTDEGRAMLLSLEEGNAGSYRLYTEYYCYSDIDAELYTSLISLDLGAVNVDVRELYECNYYEIYGADPTGSVIMPYGAIYFINDEIYFLSYIDLPNSAFTSDGYFSFMKGSVDLYPVGDTLAIELATLADSATHSYPSFIYEAEDGFEIDESTEITVFYVIFAIVMLLSPTVFLGISLALAAVGKHRSKRLWLVGALLALLWIAVSVAILVIIS